MYCINCGNKLSDTDRFCPECGTENTTGTNITPVSNTQTNNQTVNNNNEMSPEDKKNADMLCVISLICTFGGSLVTAVFPPAAAITGIMPLAGLILMIVARVKYPKSTFAKVLMWLYIVLYVMAVLAVILMVYALVIACTNCPG